MNAGIRSGLFRSSSWFDSNSTYETTGSRLIWIVHRATTVIVLSTLGLNCFVSISPEGADVLGRQCRSRLRPFPNETKAMMRFLVHFPPTVFARIFWSLTEEGQTKRNGENKKLEKFRKRKENRFFHKK